MYTGSHLVFNHSNGHVTRYLKLIFSMRSFWSFGRKQLFCQNMSGNCRERRESYYMQTWKSNYNLAFVANSKFSVWQPSGENRWGNSKGWSATRSTNL